MTNKYYPLYKSYLSVHIPKTIFQFILHGLLEIKYKARLELIIVQLCNTNNSLLSKFKNVLRDCIIY